MNVLCRLLLLSLVWSACAACDAGHDEPDLSDIEGLVAYYPFDGGAQDRSGWATEGAVSGARLTDDRFGRAQSAFAFDGVDDVIEIPHAEHLDVGRSERGYSVSLWVRGQDPVRARILQKWDEQNQTPYPFSVRAEPNNLNAVIYDAEQLFPVVAPEPWDGRWHHVALVVDAADGTAMLLLDGVLTSTHALALAGATSNASALYIGGGERVDRFFRGEIDDIRIFDRPLTGEDLVHLYHEGGWAR